MTAVGLTHSVVAFFVLCRFLSVAMIKHHDFLFKILVCIHSLPELSILARGKSCWDGLPSMYWTTPGSLHSCPYYPCCSPQLFHSHLLCLPPSTSAPQRPILHLAVRYVLDSRRQNRPLLCRTGSTPLSRLPVPVLSGKAFCSVSKRTSFLLHSTLPWKGTLSLDFSHGDLSP